MKIILAAKSVYPFHPFGGVQKNVYYFAKHLARAGVSVEVIAPLDGKKPRQEVLDGVTFTLIEPDIYKYLEYPVGWWGVHRFSQSLADYLQTRDFDILHSFDMAGYRYACQQNHRPVISQIFTDNYLCNPLSLWNPDNWLALFGRRTANIKKTKVRLSPYGSATDVLRYPLQYYFKVQPIHRCLSASQAVFFEDEIFKEEVCRLFRIPDNKCRVLPVGVDIAVIDQHSKPADRARLGFHRNDIVLLTVNRLAADKGVDRLVMALAQIRKTHPQVKLLIIGQGYQQKEIEQLITDQGLTEDVHLLQNVAEDELYSYYRAANLYVCAFSYPGSSVSTLEAMACGLPIITSAQPWLVEEGACGCYLPDNDPSTIRQAVVKCLNSEQLAEMGKVSRRRVVDFDWPHIVRQAVDCYEELLSFKGSPDSLRQGGVHGTNSPA